MNPAGESVNRLACRVNDRLLIAMVKDAHVCPLKKSLEFFGSVSFLRLGPGTMRKLPEFWFDYGQDAADAFIIAVVAIGMWVLFLVAAYIVTRF